MLVKIHKNVRPFVPTDLTQAGELKKPFIGLRGPGGVTVNLYGGTLGMAGLEALCENLRACAPETGAEYVNLEGIRPANNGIGFIGFATDVEITPVDAEDLAWAKGLDRQALRASVEAQVGGIATAARQSSTRRPVPASAPTAAANNDDLPF